MLKHLPINKKSYISRGIRPGIFDYTSRMEIAMKIINKIKEKQKDIHGTRQPVIAFLGDSVTQGCFDLYIQNGRWRPYTESNKAYHEKVREIFAMLYPDVPLNIINAGISGDCAKNAFKRLHRDVLSFSPDLVVVCFGLNDASFGENGIEEYQNALELIFSDVIESGAELIFMTPNLRTEKLDMPRADESFNQIARNVAENENDGWLEKYLCRAKKVCEKMGVPVCDCHKLWGVLKDGDVDINKLLSNNINHPTEKMLWMFAYELVKIMFTE